MTPSYALTAQGSPLPHPVQLHPKALDGARNVHQSLGGFDGDALTDYRGHNRNCGFTANLTPRERLGFDFAYNYDGSMQNAFICFNDSDTSLPVVANAGSCIANGCNDSKNPLLTDWPLHK